MLILIDLDGTLIYTVHPSWKPYKDGQENYNINNFLDKVPFFPGAKEFIASRKLKGDRIVIVSDSHFRYVQPISNMLGVECLPLADKPNLQKLKMFLKERQDLIDIIKKGDYFFIGDTKLDIEIGRKIGAKTIYFLPYQITDEIKNERDGIGDEMISRKMGPTYEAKSFLEIEHILNNPLENLYSIEAEFAGSSSFRSINLNYNQYRDGSFACIQCLARQEQGACDKYACGDKYILMSNSGRSENLLNSLARGISTYMNQDIIRRLKWDYFTYLTDKQSTVPANKLKVVFDRVETTIPKVTLFKWAENVSGSLRDRYYYADRQSFLKNYLSIECPIERVNQSEKIIEQPISLEGKNVIVLDDQLTTAATAWYVIHKLKEKGVKNVLFIAMFQMILSVNNDILCPRCGKPMLVKIRRSDGHRFLSCTPPQYKGNGCGLIIDIQN